MKKIYILIILCFTGSLLSTAFADTTSYGKVLYRVNCGGWGINSKDTSNVNWVTDDSNTPSPFIDTLVMGNKTYGIVDSVALTASVPTSTPYLLFRTERDLGSGANQLEYNFAIPAGQKVQVRLYFAENYLDSITKRLMNISIENLIVLYNFDIFAQAGKNKGLMKSFIATSDGNLDIDLIRIKQLPIIHGIEIIELNTVSVAGIFNANKNALSFSAYPNPFVQEVSLDLGNHIAESIQIFDSFGREIPVVYQQAGSLVNIQMLNYPKGIYYVQTRVDKYKTETLRLIKE